jgi:HK97 family phage prohead protease|nr:MAG TPA: prohead protease [Caudoviricetes sp.]
MKKITKLFTSKSVSVNEKERTAQFIISDDQVDRMDEIVEQSWDTGNYENNPIVLWGHNPEEPENVLGTSLGLETEKGDDDVTRTKSTVKFSEEGLNPKADMVFNQIKAGILRTVSVGFIPKTFKTSEDKKDVLADNELLEFSIVPIPANPRAVALAFKEGTISRKDARFMIDSMNKEAQLLQEELDSDKNKEEQERNTKTMSDEDIQKVAEAISTAFNEAFAPVIEKLNAIADKVGAEDNEDSDSESDNNENQDGEKQAKSEAETAKEGENDHSGADEVDEDTELTPEQEEEFAKEFEKALKEEQEK